jgi:cytochrome c556
MTRVKKVRALGATLSLLAVTAVQAQTATPAEKAIEYRQAVFKVVAGNFGPLAQSAQGKVELQPAAARQYAERLSEISQFARDAFPDISGEGKTRAKPEIWSERAEFDKLLKDLTDATKALAGVTANAAAKPEEFKAAVGSVGNACKGCHDRFREK